MGADEYVYCSDGVSHEYDINADGIINLIEFEGLTDTWLTIPPDGDPNLGNIDPDWTGLWDLNDDVIDIVI